MEELKIAAAYIRVSTDDQLELSPDAQIFELRKWAGKNGYIIPDAHIFIEEGISGKKADKRPAFQQMIATAKAKPHPFEAILLWKFSRFARNQEESIVYKNMLKKEKIDVISISEPVIDGPFGSLIERIIEWMDEYYLINLGEEVKRGMTEKARRGELQSTPSFGYRVENNRLVPVPDEAALVRQIFNRFVDGEGLFPIARWLNSMGIKTHRGNVFENRTIEYILRNPVYIGKLRWNPAGRTRRKFDDDNIILSDSDHEPLITMEIWDAAQSRMAAVKAQWRYKGRPSTELKDWISGLVHCSVCGGILVRNVPCYYKCGNYARGSCQTTQWVKDDDLKEAIISRLELDTTAAHLLPSTIISASDTSRTELDQLRYALETVNKKMLRLREAYLSGADSAEEYKVFKEKLSAQAATIQSQIDAFTSAPIDNASSDLLKQAIARVVDVLRSPDATIVQKHDAALSVIESCTWDKAASHLSITYRLCL